MKTPLVPANAGTSGLSAFRKGGTGLVIGTRSSPAARDHNDAGLMP